MDYNAKQIQIIEVAERLFAQKGFSGTSVRDIAQEADINVSMISYYFGSKEKLIEALFKIRTVESRSRIETIISNDDLTPIQKVYILIDSVIERLMGNQCFHNIMMREQLSSERTPIISDHIMNLKMKNTELMQTLITGGQDAGVFRKNIDFSLMTTTLYGTINQAIATQHFYRKINHLEDLSEEEFQNLMKRKLSQHLKNLFKLTVSNEHQNQH
ncbi:TetR/AcrR family transcriptional regulator [Dyadobacter psychrotolerans]|uniref:TetR/AcrR family transcriptional regulator n=1 Tax=Dyadobacter psychrotolerans TaxID=2541721 RepID=A0A4R5DP42_9BACT|nr:TetR family transcriptional regulator [Dyadobacter psychrotolerans]TDE15337.1 TetR/AcrR family transcriptional regulator [Dyadobacter psychrotolerans]